MQRFTFNARRQHEGESVADFVAFLRQLAEHCEFGTALEDMLRDRIVCGILNARVQRRLLAEPKLTLNKAVEVAQTAELAEKGARLLQQQVDSKPEVEEVQKVTKDTRQVYKPCYHCGRLHESSTCPCKTWFCKACGKKGDTLPKCVGAVLAASHGSQGGIPRNRLRPAQ